MAFCAWLKGTRSDAASLTLNSAGTSALPNSNPSKRWEYRDAEGKLLCYTERVEKPGGGKDIKPFTWSVSKTGAKQWKRKGLSAPHPPYSYEADADLGLDLRRPLSDTEAYEKILELCRDLRWRKPVSGDLLVVLAPFSGALQWRPHIWLTGTAGAGETTVVNKT
jgi:hypothetical protein